MKFQKWDDDVTDFSFSGVFDPKSMHSSCIIRIMSKKDLRAFKERLNKMSQFAWYPLYLPIFFLEMRLQRMPQALSTIRQFLVRVERTTGTHKNYQQRLGLTTHKNGKVQEMWSEPDFEAAPGELTSIASDCVYFESLCQTRLRLLTWLESIHSSIVEANDTLSHEPAIKVFSQKIQFMKMWVTEVESRCVYFGKRAGIQLQMVCVYRSPTGIPILLHKRFTK
jgi:hypothetical protein